MNVLSLTPSRIGIITSRLMKSKASVRGTNFAGVSLAEVFAGSCAPAFSAASDKRRQKGEPGGQSAAAIRHSIGSSSRQGMLSELAG